MSMASDTGSELEKKWGYSIARAVVQHQTSLQQLFHRSWCFARIWPFAESNAAIAEEQADGDDEAEATVQLSADSDSKSVSTLSDSDSDLDSAQDSELESDSAQDSGVNQTQIRTPVHILDPRMKSFPPSEQPSDQPTQRIHNPDL